MHILVTGGCGFVGSYLCQSLRQQFPGYKITALDNFVRKGSELNKKKLQDIGIDIMAGDIRFPDTFDGVTSFDIMIDAAAEPSVLAGTKGDHRYLIDNNFIGTLNCLDACIQHQALLIYLSTSRVYPYSRINSLPHTEEESRYTISDFRLEGLSTRGISESFKTEGAKTFYGASKFASEVLIEEYRATLGLKSIINRCGIIAGPGQLGKVDQGIAVYWCAAHFWKKPLAYFGFEGSGKQVRDFLHIHDLTRLVLSQIQEPDRFSDHVYQVGGGWNNTLSLLELTTLCNEFSGNTLKIGKRAQNRPGDIRIYYSDCTLLEKRCGWRPHHTCTDIIQDIFKWLDRDEDKLRNILL